MEINFYYFYLAYVKSSSFEQTFALDLIELYLTAVGEEGTKNNKWNLLYKETNEWWLIEVSYRLFVGKKYQTEKGFKALKERKCSTNWFLWVSLEDYWEFCTSKQNKWMKFWWWYFHFIK